MYQDGNLTPYTLFMIDTYGRDEVERLQALVNEKLKITESDYEDMIEEFKGRLKVLL